MREDVLERVTRLSRGQERDTQTLRLLPVVVVKDPFTWMRSMCRARPAFFSSASAAFIIRAQAWSTPRSLDMGRCRLSVKNELQLAGVAAMASS